MGGRKPERRGSRGDGAWIFNSVERWGGGRGGAFLIAVKHIFFVVVLFLVRHLKSGFLWRTLKRSTTKNRVSFMTDLLVCPSAKIGFRWRSVTPPRYIFVGGLYVLPPAKIIG